MFNKKELEKANERVKGLHDENVLLLKENKVLKEKQTQPDPVTGMFPGGIQMPRRETFIMKLKVQRDAALAAIQEKEELLIKIDSWILWLERHPTAEGIMLSILERNIGDQPKTDTRNDRRGIPGGHQEAAVEERPTKSA